MARPWQDRGRQAITVPGMYDLCKSLAASPAPAPAGALALAGSVDGLVEASRQSRVCGGAGNPVSCMVFKVLMEVSKQVGKCAERVRQSRPPWYAARSNVLYYTAPCTTGCRVRGSHT